MVVWLLYFFRDHGYCSSALRLTPRTKGLLKEMIVLSECSAMC